MLSQEGRRMGGADLVGTVIDRVSFPVEEGKIREFAVAVGDPNPVYRDRELALAAGHRAIPAPLSFVVTAGHWRDQSAMVATLGVDITRVVVGETGWEFHRPIYAGDRLSAARVVESVTERPGRRGGMMTLIVIVAEFVNQHDEITVVQRDTVIEMGA
jgi:acyl dehydratase